jgi:diacylglycerol kinase family enzyme
MPVTPIKIIISAVAGPADNNKACERLAEIFNEQQIEADITFAYSGAEVIELAREAASGPYKVIVAAGVTERSIQ